jgi:Holliday junction resolvase RusA-like endonuclease
MKFTIQGELTDLNTYINAERTHRQSGAKIKKSNTDLCLWQLKGLKPIAGLHIIHFKWYMPNKMKDPDNISFAKKYILDAMVKAGIIENDGWRNIAGFIDEFEVDSKPKIEIEFKEVV